MHTQYTCMQEARAHYIRRHKTTKSKGIRMSTRTAIATRFLNVLIFLVRQFKYDFVVRDRLKSFFFSEKYHTIKEL